MDRAVDKLYGLKLKSGGLLLWGLVKEGKKDKMSDRSGNKGLQDQGGLLHKD